MFTIDPPLHVRGRETAMISSIEQAAAFLRTHPARHDDDEMLVQLENVSTTEDAKIAGEAFRAWVQDQGVLLVPAYPEPDNDNAAAQYLRGFVYDPPLRPIGRDNVVITNLDEAADFVRRIQTQHYDTETQGILARLEAASTAAGIENAANAFRAWLEKGRFL